VSPRRKKVRLWSYMAGEEPHSVYVFERYAGSVLHIQAWNPVTKSRRKRSLGHKDRVAAMEEAEAEAKKLREGSAPRAAPATVGSVLAAYVAHRTPKKVATTQSEDRRRAELWAKVLGSDRRVLTLGPAEWEHFKDLRSSGAIDARGNRVPEEGKRVLFPAKTPEEVKRAKRRKGGGGEGGRYKVIPRRPAGPRTVTADLDFIVSVFNWACQWNGSDGRPLLERNPWGAHGPGVKRVILERPKNRAPRRPVATYDRYLAVRAAADRVLMRVPKGTPGAHLVRVGDKASGSRRTMSPCHLWMRPSYLAELLELTEQTGRRIGAICRLSYDDIVRRGGAIVALRWRPFKSENQTIVPVSAETRETLERILRDRPGLGAHPLFPSIADPLRPIDKRMAIDWLRRAEIEAGLPHLEGGSFHPYRRKWEIERKRHPEADVMAAQGRKDVRSLRESYRLADEATMIAVVNEPSKLRGGAG
jgi:integrase